MSFVQGEFLVLLAVVWLLHRARHDRRWQNGVLVLGSVVFYGWTTWWWVPLLLATAWLDFGMGQLMARSPGYRRLWLGLSLVANLGLLFVFKYLAFCVEQVVAALALVGVDVHANTVALVLPAGISFYTFQTISYTVDVYRGELRPRRSLLDYTLYVAYFPQLVAGPIERATRLLPQLEVARTASAWALRSGVGLALWGAFKKVVIADTLAPYVDKVFLLREPSAPLMWAATTAFMLQIYADFSGYTDIARGVSRLFGVELARNFDEPYLATTTPEFWQRWHMSLSSWVRDYLLAPLLGSGASISPLRFLSAVTLTMVLMGLWHGAGLNFLLFGLFHALCITVYTVITRVLPASVNAIPGGRVLAAAFHLLVVGEIGALLFRESSVARIATQLTRSPFVGPTDEWAAAIGLLGICAVLNFPLVVEHFARRHVLPELERSPWYLPAQTAAWALWIVLIALGARMTRYDFVYFQF